MNDISQLARSSRGLTRLGVAFGVFALSAGAFQFGVQAQEESPRYRPREADSAPAGHQQLLDRQERKAQERWQESNLARFRKPNGKVILTNNPEKYRNRRGYTELDPHASRPLMTLASSTSRSGALSNVKSVASVRGIPDDIKRHVSYHARLNNLDESLVYAVIKAESSFNRTARSSKGAQGLMQLMPGTAAQLGVRNPFDAGENIRGGTRYLAMLLDRFDNDLQLALAGYNAGPEKVKEYGGIPPYDETRKFVRRVIENRNYFVDNGVSLASSDAGSSVRTVAAVSRDNRRRAEYLVHFTSGHVQEAQNVVDSGDDYIIQYLGRSFRVKKSQVSSVRQGA